MENEEIVKCWFQKWELGDFENLPITENFVHYSPFGKIVGKDSYFDLVRKNRDKFLGYTFTIHEAIYGKKSACVRYTAHQNSEFKLEVSEWYYFIDTRIAEIRAYYHIGEIREDRKLDRS